MATTDCVAVIDQNPLLRHRFGLLNGQVKCKFTTLKGKNITNRIVCIANMGDIHPFRDGPVFDAETVFLDACDKNFVYYHLNRKTFPNLKHVYLASHPCDFPVLHRFGTDTIVHLSDYYSIYKQRWAVEEDHVQLMPKADMKAYFAAMRIEELQFRE